MMSRRLILVVPLLLLTGCVGALLGTKKTAVDLYRLTPVAPAGASELPSRPWRLAIEEPQARGLLSGDRILARPEPARLQPIAGIRWVQRLPEMLHTLLLESFEATGRLEAVTRAELGARADLRLVTEVRILEAEFGAGTEPPTVRLRLAASVVSGQDVVAARVFDHSASASGGDAAAIVAAANTVWGEVLADLLPWVLAVPVG